MRLVDLIFGHVLPPPAKHCPQPWNIGGSDINSTETHQIYEQPCSDWDGRGFGGMQSELQYATPRGAASTIFLQLVFRDAAPDNPPALCIFHRLDTMSATLVRTSSPGSAWPNNAN